MCGITGFLKNTISNTEQNIQILQRMTDEITHRGPDAAGVWSDPEAGIFLGHRRLSILDLSPAGHQPMASTSERFQLVFNGEIYNHLELRVELDNRFWRGHSDTETLLAGVDQWGLKRTLQKCVGMFALALWDRKERTLTLARDRMGEKPLYYGWQGGSFLFASELKAMRCHPSFVGIIHTEALADVLRYGCVGGEKSIYQNIYKLLPGTFLTLPAEVVLDNLPASKSYWSLNKAIISGKKNLFAGSELEAVNNLDGLIRKTISGQMLSDVPLGAFLSGGIDSSTIVALMQECSDRHVKTFTIGFQEAGYNEAGYAKEIAKHLQTDHTELYVSNQDMLNVVPNLPSMYDEPFADSSQIPTFLVSQMARQNVTVALSGDGGDELFAGYRRYLGADALWRKIHNLPRVIRKSISGGINLLSPESWNVLGELTSGSKYTGLRMHSLSATMKFNSVEDFYQRMTATWKNPSDILLGDIDESRMWKNSIAASSKINFIERLMFQDANNYLPNDILTKVDRAGMAVSLETRIPLLDHRIVEFAWSLPFNMKINNSSTKLILRKVLDKYVPKELIERPKKGFGAPIDIWLRGPLREWAEELLDENRLQQEGFFNPKSIRKKWKQHLSGRFNWKAHLWHVLMFQAWLEHNKR